MRHLAAAWHPQGEPSSRLAAPLVAGSSRQGDKTWPGSEATRRPYQGGRWVVPALPSGASDPVRRRRGRYRRIAWIINRLGRSSSFHDHGGRWRPAAAAAAAVAGTTTVPCHWIWSGPTLLNCSGPDRLRRSSAARLTQSGPPWPCSIGDPTHRAPFQLGILCCPGEPAAQRRACGVAVDWRQPTR